MKHGAPEGPADFAALTLRRRLGELPSFALGGEAAPVPRLPIGSSFGQSLLSAFDSAFDPALLAALGLVPLYHGMTYRFTTNWYNDISNSPVLFTARVSSIATIVMAMPTVPKSASTAKVKSPTSSHA